jgi:EAL domain-containing protein (putative c-di-GMP-specific phosphodiesterase class I)
MNLHKEWLKKLRLFLQDTKNNEPPIMEHNLCAFADWLKTLESKLILHACRDQQFDMQGNILLSHRKVHEEASFVHIYISQKDYLKALAHFEHLSQAYLLLDKYINEANFIYSKRPYYNFIDFVMNEGKQRNDLKYYFVIHYGLFEQAVIQNNREKALLDSFAKHFLTQLSRHDIEHIQHLENSRLHVVVKHEYGNHSEKVNQLIDSALDEVYAEYSRILGQQLYINQFNLSDLTNFETEHFDSLLQKIQKDKYNQHIRIVNSEQIQLYQQKVAQDFLLLETIKTHFNENTFELHYQPIVDDKGHIQAIESLIRMQLEDDLIVANSFLGVVEANKLTAEIDQLVMELLYKDLPRLKAVSNQIHVNIYPKSLSKPEVIQKVIKLAKLANDLQIILMIEITEHEILIHDEVLRELNSQYHIQFAIDDFGTGYSNLANLVEFASRRIVQIAKLDGKLIEDIESDEVRFQVVRFVTDMAENLGLQPVIAEYVDSTKKLEMLKTLPSKLLYQGHYFKPALSIKQLLSEFN